MRREVQWKQGVTAVVRAGESEMKSSSPRIDGPSGTSWMHRGFWLAAEVDEVAVRRACDVADLIEECEGEGAGDACLADDMVVAELALGAEVRRMEEPEPWL